MAQRYALVDLANRQSAVDQTTEHQKTLVVGQRLQEGRRFHRMILHDIERRQHPALPGITRFIRCHAHLRRTVGIVNKSVLANLA
ncbi:MAG: hypothetical protein ACYDAH_18550 [Steroidobacteraceae bacterium]